MNNSLNTLQQKKNETVMLVILGLVLGVIILVSKFVIGINFSLMEQGGYISFGYHEVHGAQVWSLEFESFTGSISSDGVFPENSKHKLMIHSGPANSELTLTVTHGEEKNDYILSGEPLVITLPDDTEKFTLTLSGTEVISGYFNAVWE